MRIEVNMTDSSTDTLDRVEALARDHKFEEALALFQTLYDQARPSSERGKGLALEVICLEALDRVDDARELIPEVMEEEGDDHAFILAAGAAFSDLGAYHHAETFLKNLCELEPENFIAWHNLAINLGREQRYGEAINIYGKVTALSPEYPDAWYQLGYCQRLMGELDAAVDAYTKFLEQVPGDGEVWIELGVLESDREKFDRAYVAFEKATTTDEAEDAYYNWAISALGAQDADQFEACIEHLQGINPHGWRTLMARADYEEINQRVEAAWQILCDAFDSVLDQDDVAGDARDYVIATLFRFAKRNRMEKDAAAFVDRIFDEGLFTEEILAGLQALQHTPVEAVIGYQVVLKGQLDGASEPVYVLYGVSGASPEEAEAHAKKFEARCSGAAFVSFEIQQISPPQPGLPGVYWRSGVVAELPQ
jgi:tetratricopeptide (TPR) repeat protein